MIGCRQLESALQRHGLSLEVVVKKVEQGYDERRRSHEMEGVECKR